ncbi:MAG: hypothetical protein AzoDbin1_03807 [Azoarcus sp.]|nr:hypothetical protein [Azoarcus sp.]
MAEVLQGVKDGRELNLVRRTLDAFTLIDIAGHEYCGEGGQEYQVIAYPPDHGAQDDCLAYSDKVY